MDKTLYAAERPTKAMVALPVRVADNRRSDPDLWPVSVFYKRRQPPPVILCRRDRAGAL